MNIGAASDGRDHVLPFACSTGTLQSKKAKEPSEETLNALIASGTSGL